MNLTSHERIMRIFQGKEIDRPALKLWGANLDDFLLHADYRPVCELAAEKSDLFISVDAPIQVYCGRYSEERITYELADTKYPTWKDQHITIHTPKGNLHGIERISTKGDPSYTIEQLVKEPEDLEKILSLPYEPLSFDPRPFFEQQQKVGERGVALMSLDHAGHALHRLVGSENLAYFSIDCRDLLIQTLSVFSARIREFVKNAIELGVTGPFQWVGPEVYIPPLASPQDFEDFVYQFDKPLCDDIHNAGGYVWVHCHGKVANFVGRYIDMGVNILNPLEPPKNGDIDLEQIIEKYGNRIGWEGNIEIQEILLSEQSRLKELIQECVRAGNKSGRFVLCPSAGFMEYTQPTVKYIENLLFYLQYGWECVESCRIH